MNEEQQKTLEVYLQEYSKLKDEQNSRIGFRDNLIYATLAVFGIVLGLALGDNKGPDPLYALLILPWVSLVLGWTYLINDEKISAIGRYIRYTLAAKVNELTSHTHADSIFGWETIHRSDNRRMRRKIEQLIIDEITFVVSGIVALFVFLNLVNEPSPILWLWWVELILLVILGVEIYLYADLKKGR